MNRKFYDPLLREFQAGLSKINDQQLAPMPRLQNLLPYISQNLKVLREALLKHPFHTEDEEILFFKTIKPQFYSQLIFESERFNLLNNKPRGLATTIMDYYQEELRLIQRFFNNHAFHYQYYKMKINELDRAYFLRASRTDIPVPELVFDREFSTNMDYLFAKFIAYERLQEFILGEMASSPISVTTPEMANAKKIKWTGDSINLVEIAYGIWLTGQVNNGNATITDIIEFMEQKLDVKIGKPHRRWTEISQRKQLSSTKYIDQVRDALLKRIDDEHSLKRERRRSSRAD